jgi:putative transposase
MVNALLLIARWIAAAHDRWCATTATRRPLRVEVDVLKELVERLRAENDLLRGRLGRMESARRPRYWPWERLRILWHQARNGLSLRATARAFVLSTQTLLDWHKDAASSAGRVVAARVPMNRPCELATEVARRIRTEWPRWGTRRIAGILARLGLKASRSSVQRALRRPHSSRPFPKAAARAPRGRSFLAKHPNHIWMIDLTPLRRPLRTLMVGAVIDACSRRVLALRVWSQDPTALRVVGMLRAAVRAARAPAWIVTDRGTQFTAAEFLRMLRRHEVRRRYGAVHRHGSVALIERYWQTCKVEGVTLGLLYRPLATIQRRLDSYVAWFNAHRPHQGLCGRTPDEVYFDRRTAAVSVPVRAALEVRCHDGHHDLPVLALRHAA